MDYQGNLKRFAIGAVLGSLLLSYGCSSSTAETTVSTTTEVTTTTTAATTTTAVSRVEGVALVTPYDEIGEHGCEGAAADWPIGTNSTVQIEDGSGNLIGVGHLGPGVLFPTSSPENFQWLCGHPFSIEVPPYPAYRIIIGGETWPYAPSNGLALPNNGTGGGSFFTDALWAAVRSVR